MLNALQQGMKRRAIRKFLDDPGLVSILAGPLDRQTNKLMAQLQAADLTPAMLASSTEPTDYTAPATTLCTLIATNEPTVPAATVGTSPFAALIAQLVALLGPLLVSCIPAVAAGSVPTAAQVLAEVQ
jgi:hypothetical protein